MADIDVWNLSSVPDPQPDSRIPVATAPGAGGHIELGEIIELGAVAVTDALASTDSGKGASMVGLNDGNSVQGFVDALTIFRPEQYGAVGDGATDDTEAFQDLGDAVTANGGGRIILRRSATYRIGQQEFSGAADGASYRDQQMLLIEDATGLVIEGNGATLKLNDGLHYGSFDPVTGEVYDPPPGGFTDANYAATVGHIVRLVNCTKVRIFDLTIDGNQDELIVGGYWGDVDIQRRANGLTLQDVSEVEISNVTSKNNGLDGCYIKGRNLAEYGGVRDNINLNGLTLENNGRQGASVVGGKGIVFSGCVCRLTGQGTIYSSPGAGIDLEPNGSDWCTDIELNNCKIEANKGVGLIADASHARNVAVNWCEFWGGFATGSGSPFNSGDAIWLNVEGVKIQNSIVHGCISNLHASAQIIDTAFDDEEHEDYGRSAQNRGYLFTGAKNQFFRTEFSVSGTQRMVQGASGGYFKDITLNYYGSRTDSDFIASFATGTVIDGVRVNESLSSPPATGYYISASNATLRGQVHVAGPYVRWNNVSTVNDPRVGAIAEDARVMRELHLSAVKAGAGVRRIRLGTAAPTTDTWARGDIVINQNASAGGAFGWVCTTAGAPGTWNALGPIGLARVANAYTATNVTTDRSFDADTVTIAELADVVGTLLADLKTAGLLP
jgi:Endopolygalacturonase